MPLLLTNSEVQEVLTMQQCLSSLDSAYQELGAKIAVNRPRSDLYSPHKIKGQYHIFKTMEGTIPGENVVALRINSNIVRWQESGGNIRKEGVREALGGRFLGLLLLFSTDTGELLAVMPDAFLQKMRVGATNGLAAKYLAREDAATVGLIGSGWQAGAQLMAFAAVRPIKKIFVYSPNQEHRIKFSREMSEKLDMEVIPVAKAADAAGGVDILASATNSVQPVVEADWLQKGMFVSSVKHSELSPALLFKCDLVAVNSHQGDPENYLPQHGKVNIHDPFQLLAGRTADREKSFTVNWGQYPELQELIAGAVPGRKNDMEITCFVNNIGLGIQFAAAGYLTYKLAKAKGLGQQLPVDWFLQEKI